MARRAKRQGTAQNREKLPICSAVTPTIAFPTRCTALANFTFCRHIVAARTKYDAGLDRREVSPMSFFDGNARSPVSAGVTRVGAAQYDAGLRAYMLGIYNHMTLGL